MSFFEKTSVEKKININIVVSFLLKFLSVLLNFLLVRVTLNYLGKDLYGIWIVLLSIVSWIAIFDIGIGNGLRNKIAESISKNASDDIKRYISTSYIIILLICLVIALALLLLIPNVNWNNFFKTNSIDQVVLKKLVSVYFFTLVIFFFLNLINPILNAFQLSAATSLSNVFSNSSFIIILYGFKDYFYGNLNAIVIVYCFCLILGIACLNLFFFIRNKHLLPSVKAFRIDYSKDILKLGGAFFIIQIAALIIFTVDNYLILNLLGSTYVSEYNVVYRLFSIFTIGFTMIVTPYWSAFTDAYFRNDKEWMRRSIKKLNMYLIPTIIMIIIAIFAYQFILNIWLDKDRIVQPSLSLVLYIAAFTFISIWNIIYSYFLNSINRTRMQTKTAIFGALINIPLAYFFVTKWNMGLEGVVLAMIISLLPFAILGPIATKYFLKER